MIRQITGQTAQQVPPLPITNQDSITQQAAATTEPQATEEAVEEAKKPPTDKQNGKTAKDNEAASTSRY